MFWRFSWKFRNVYSKLSFKQICIPFVLLILIKFPEHNLFSLCWYMSIYGLGLWWLTPPSTIFQLYCGCQFYFWRKPEYRRKQPTCRKSLTNFIRQSCIEHTSPWVGMELTTFVNPTSIQSRPKFDKLWQNSIFDQYSGNRFTYKLGRFLIVMLMKVTESYMSFSDWH